MRAMHAMVRKAIAYWYACNACMKYPKLYIPPSLPFHKGVIRVTSPSTLRRISDVVPSPWSSFAKGPHRGQLAAMAAVVYQQPLVGLQSPQMAMVALLLSRPALQEGSRVVVQDRVGLAAHARQLRSRMNRRRCAERQGESS